MKSFNAGTNITLKKRISCPDNGEGVILEEAVRRGTVDSFSLQAISARIAYDGLLCAPERGPDLETYDRAFLDRKVSS
jgi:hypothetical protein